MGPLEPHDGHFLAGLIDAEACFRLPSTNGGANWACTFSLALRDDDGQLLVELHDLTRLGTLRNVPAAGTSRPQVVWSIERRPECEELADLLEQFPLRGRKRLETEIWA